jgi:hypothetical protein
VNSLTSVSSASAFGRAGEFLKLGEAFVEAGQGGASFVQTDRA